MFSYYGSKSKVVDYYPPPKYGRIIEPFAGSARYSLKYWQNDVLLVDKYQTVYDIWRYLQQASISDINKLPRLQKGEVIPEGLSDIEKKFMGFIISDGACAPQKKTTKFSNNPNKVRARLNRIAKQLFKIKHWDIRLCCYDKLQNEECTWFIDPPYQFGGEHYKEGNENIDFVKLAEWCKNRKGQTIVCENTKATWLPFKPMKEMKGSKYKTIEAIWSNHRTNYDNIQLKLDL